MLKKLQLSTLDVLLPVMAGRGVGNDEAEGAMDDGRRAGGRGGDGDDGGEAGATAEEAATVVNGRIDGGFGPDMAAAVAMNGLTVRELLTWLRLVCFGRAHAGLSLPSPLLVVGFCKDFCL